MALLRLHQKSGVALGLFFYPFCMVCLKERKVTRVYMLIFVPPFRGLNFLFCVVGELGFVELGDFKRVVLLNSFQIIRPFINSCHKYDSDYVKLVRVGVELELENLFTQKVLILPCHFINTLNSRNLCAIKHIQYWFSPLNYHQ